MHVRAELDVLTEADENDISIYKHTYIYTYTYIYLSIHLSVYIYLYTILSTFSFFSYICRSCTFALSSMF